MTHVQTNGHDVHAEHAPKPPPRGWRRFTAPGWLRALWMAPLFWAIGAGLVWCSLLNWLILMVPTESRGAALGAAIRLLDEGRGNMLATVSGQAVA